MARTKITVRMSPQLRRNLQTEYTIGAPVRDYLENTTELIRDTARRESPVDLGEMRKSHVAVVDPRPVPQWGRMEVQARGRNNAPYPVFVHEGTRPHWPPIEAIRPWAERHGIPPFVLARSIAEKGTRANPWLERTLNMIGPRLRNLGRLSRNIVRRWNAR